MKRLAVLALAALLVASHVTQTWELLTDNVQEGAYDDD